MFIRRVGTLIDESLYNRCIDLSKDYFDRDYYKYPELQQWAETTRRYIIQVWRLQNQLKYYRDNIDLNNFKNYNHYKYGKSLLESFIGNVFEDERTWFTSYELMDWLRCNLIFLMKSQFQCIIPCLIEWLDTLNMFL